MVDTCQVADVSNTVRVFWLVRVLMRISLWSVVLDGGTAEVKVYVWWIGFD